MGANLIANPSRYIVLEAVAIASFVFSAPSSRAELDIRSKETYIDEIAMNLIALPILTVRVS